MYFSGCRVLPLRPGQPAASPDASVQPQAADAVSPVAEADEDPGIEMWGDKDHLGIDARCTYHPKTRNFRVTATWKGHVLTREFPSSYEPKFGMDVQDQQDSFDIAEALALELERLAKSPKFGLANLTKQNRRLDQRV